MNTVGQHAHRHLPAASHTLGDTLAWSPRLLRNWVVTWGCVGQTSKTSNSRLGLPGLLHEPGRLKGHPWVCLLMLACGHRLVWV